MGIKEDEKGIAIYHCIKKYEDFNRAANNLFNLVKEAKEKYPERKIGVYIDIEGHKTREGAFDEDMFELQSYFIMEQIYPYVSEIHEPLAEIKNNNPKNNIPKQLLIKKEEK